MALRQRVYSVLVVSSSDKFTATLCDLLPETDYCPVKTVTSVGAARRALLERSYDFVLVNTPLPDEFGTRLAMDVCAGSDSVALIFVRSDLFGEIYSKVVDHGVISLPKPTSASSVSQAMNMLCSVRERLRRLEKKTLSVEEKMEEIRLVNRAKWLLIEQLSMSETDAHRYIEKQAMDRCVTRRQVSEDIIRAYS